MGLTRRPDVTPAAEAAGGPASRGRDEVLGLLMLAFDGFELPPVMAERLAVAPAAGISLFRFINVASAPHVRDLTAAIQHAGARTADEGPLLIAADQEGGQFLALGDDATPFAGNMALGAAGDRDLAERVGRAIGLEMRALGINVGYAPVCDVASDPANPGIGIRSFGDDPIAVGSLAAAMVRGLRSAGVAASAKHFPGLGAVVSDSHHGLPVLDVAPDRLRNVELAPFRAAIASGADLVMSAHIALPALTGDPTLPATLSRAVMHDLLRDELGFRGLAITDALDMGALPQGPEQAIDAIAALRAGMDLLLLAPNEAARARIEAALVHGAMRGLLEAGSISASLARIRALRAWLAGFGQPDLEVVGSVEHRRIANELATRSITLVRDDADLLPLRLPSDARVAAIMPRPRDITPADTSSRVEPALAAALRAQHPHVEEFVTGQPPTEAEIAALRIRASEFELLIVGTIAASLDPAQAALVDALVATGVPTVTVALRTPFDLATYPWSASHVCTYGILRPTLDALAAALFGRGSFPGHLPAAVPGLYPTGHGLTT